MLKSVEIRKCDMPAVVMSVFTNDGDGGGGLKELTSPTSFLHGHLVVDGKGWGSVGSKAQVRELVQKRTDSDKLGAADLELFEKAIAGAAWLPDVLENNVRITSPAELSAGPRGLLGGLLDILRGSLSEAKHSDGEANERMAQYLMKSFPPALRIYRSKDGLQIGMIQVLGTEHNPITDLTEFFRLVQTVTGTSGLLKADDFSHIHTRLLQEGFEFVVGKRPEGFTEFVELGESNDRIGELVDANGRKIVAGSKYVFLKHLTGDGKRFTSELVGKHIDEVNNSKLSTVAKPSRLTLGLGDGYSVTLIYAGDKLIEATAGYKAPVATATSEAVRTAPDNAEAEQPAASADGGQDIDEALATEPLPAAGPAEEHDRTTEAASS